MMFAPPLTYDGWRALKAATRHQRYQERLHQGDDASAGAWLAAVARDDRTDPYEHVPALEPVEPCPIWRTSSPR